MTYIQEDEPSQEERIAKLRAELEKLGGTMLDRLESIPADMEEEFLRHVLEYETQEPISLLTWLAKSGIEVPDPDQLDDKTLSIKLQEVIYLWDGLRRCIPTPYKSSFRPRTLRVSFRLFD
jgi:hypothetical protein